MRGRSLDTESTGRSACVGAWCTSSRWADDVVMPLHDQRPLTDFLQIVESPFVLRGVLVQRLDLCRRDPLFDLGVVAFLAKTQPRASGNRDRLRGFPEVLRRVLGWTSDLPSRFHHRPRRLRAAPCHSG